MSKISWKSLLPYLTALLLFVAIAVVYFYPVLQGYSVKTTDITQHRGMASELNAHRDKFDEEPLWVGNMFSGMPAYQVSTVRYDGSILGIFYKIMTLGFSYPIGLLILYLTGFYILLLCLKIDPWLAIVGAIAFAFSTYFIIIVEAGHTSKAFAISFMPPLLGGIISILRGRILVGSMITAIYMGMELYANHLQITYYLMYLILIVGLVEMFNQIKQGETAKFFKRSIIVLLAVFLGILPNLGNLILTYEYSKFSTRSESELTMKPDGTSNSEVLSTGLDKDYITRWSYGLEESFSLMIPNVKGGASGAILADQEEVDRLRRVDPSFFNFMVEQYQNDRYVVNTYWGNQPFTSGPVYLGIVVCFLAFLALFYVKDSLVIGLGIAGLMALLLSWGKNFMPLSDFFIEHVPLYNKFRAVSMILVIIEVVAPLLAILFLSKLIKDRSMLADNMKRFYILSGAFTGLLVLFYLIPDAFFDFLSQKDLDQMDKLLNSNPNQRQQIYGNFEKVENIRIDALRSDILSVGKFLLLSILLLILFSLNKLKSKAMIAGIGGLILVDLWVVNKQFINNKEKEGASRTSTDRYVKYEKLSKQKTPHNASSIDYAILQTEIREHPELRTKIEQAENELKSKERRPSLAKMERARFTTLMRNTHYRVLNTAMKLDEDAKTAYFHKTLGGYHGAKMKKYQELIDFELGIEHYQLRQAFSQGGQRLVQQMLPQMNTTNMLNAKYVIGLEKGSNQMQEALVRNKHALGNAWFVDSYKLVSTADEEITSLKNLDPAKEAVIRDKYKEYLGDVGSGDGQIQLKSYLPNELVYEYQASDNGLVVFSEIYYDKGWNAYIDGKELPFFAVNYTLRGMVVPKGSGEIIFKFEPVSYEFAQITSWISSILLLLLLGYVGYRKFSDLKAE